MTLEQLELAITQYLDGTLPAVDVSALEQTLASDPQAAELLKEHERLTALLRSHPIPEMGWGELARDLSAVVTGSVDEQTRAEDQKLNAILRAATPLPELRWDELAQRISAAVDAEVVGTDAQDDKFDAMLRSTPMPAINWDRLAGHLSDAVAAEVEGAKEAERPAVIGRIGWARTVSRLAIAASVLVASGLGIAVYFRSPSAVVRTNPIPVNPPAFAEVTTPRVETAAQPAVAEISIGPSKSYAIGSDEELYRRGVASRSPVVIATPVSVDEDGDHSLGFD